MIFIPTLHCGGRCEEAIALYKKAFNLEVDWQGKDKESNLIITLKPELEIKELDCLMGAQNGRKFKQIHCF